MADRFQFLLVAPLVALGSFFCDAATAQIIPDRTLGAESSSIKQETIQGIKSDLITGGATRGANLFHSFSEFNIQSGRGAYFANPAAINNIFTRVTGGNPSNILGTLGVLGNANLFLINPNGISFGANARLDLKGSFVASTANSLVFSNNLEFSATNPQAPPLLTVNIPIGLKFRDNVGDINNAGNLTVDKDLILQAQNLNLSGTLQAGGNLTLQAQDTLTVRDSVEQPFIAAAGNQLLIQGNRFVDIFALYHVNSGLFSGGDMVLRSANTVGGDAHYWSGGNFRIEQLDGSLGNLSSPHDPVIRSLGDVLLNGYIGSSLHILAGGLVYIPGTIEINAADTTGNTINPTNTPTLANVTLSNGNSLIIDGTVQPTLDIRAGMNPEAIGNPLGLLGNNFLAIGGGTFDIPNGAGIFTENIQITAPGGIVYLTNQYEPNLSLLDGNIIISGINIPTGQINTSSFSGNGGSVIIDSRQGITLNASIIDTSSILGNGGDVTLLAKNDILLTPSSSFPLGSSIITDGLLGGNITLNSGGNISARDSLISSNSWTTASNVKGGDINIISRSLFLDSNSQIINNTFGRAISGNVNINTLEFITIDGGVIDAGTVSQGNAGNLTINTRRLLVQNGGQISNGTSNEGNGGSLIVNAPESVQLIGASSDSLFPSGLFTQTTPNSTGNAGNITINTGELLIRDGAEVFAGSPGLGSGGKIEVNASASVQVIGRSANGRLPSGISTQTISKKGTGDLEITTRQLLIKDGAQVDTITAGEGRGGNLRVNASESVQVIGRSAYGDIGSGLSTQTQGIGDAGDLSIITGRLIVQDRADVRTDSIPSVGQAGDAGNLNIKSEQLIIENGAEIAAGTFGQGKGGNLTVTASDFIEINGSGSGLFTQTEGSGNAGDINLTTRKLIVQDKAKISTGSISNAENAGDAGNLLIQTGQLIIQDGSQIATGTRGEGNAGSLTVTASDFIEATGISIDGFPSGLGTTTSGKGSAGDLKIITDQLIIQKRATISTSTSGAGKAGNLTITTRGLVVKEGAQIQAGTFGEGNGGTLTINATDLVELSGTSENSEIGNGLFTQSQGSGNAGDLKVTTRQLITKDGSIISASTTDSGKGGNIEIQTKILSLSNDSRIVTRTIGQGNAGNILVQEANSITLSDGSQFRTDTSGQGDAGIITIDSPNAIISLEGDQPNPSGIVTIVQPVEGFTSDRQAGDITIKGRSLSLSNGAQINALTAGQGNAGNIFIETSDAISLVNNSLIVSTAEAGAIGNAGAIDIKGRSLFLTDNSQITTNTFRQGNAGNISVRIGDAISLANRSAILSSVSPGGIGIGGNIDIKGRSLSLTEGSQIQTNLFRTQDNFPGGQGQAGNIFINTTDFVNLFGVSPDGFSSGLLASTEQGANGNAGSITVTTNAFRVADGAIVDTLTANTGEAGDITINANTFAATGGGQVITTTRSSGSAGDITLNITDSIDISGSDLTFANRLANFGEAIVNNQGAASGLFANTAPGSTGNGGSIIIDPDQVNLNNNAQISVNSQGQGNGGNISLTSNNLTLNNASTISATTASGEGGNITLKIANLLRQRNNSPISATAGGTGNGGNITINTNFLVANQNSDITANAFAGRGGNINITTQGLFFAPNSQITASSELGVEGVVQINTPETDPSRGLVDLPEIVVDPNTLIAQNACLRGKESQFTITGRGGLPSSPEQFQTSDEVEVSLIAPTQESATRITSPLPTTVTPEKIVPAQGWIRNEKGRVVLVGYDPTNTNFQRQEQNLSSCQPR
ncbi:filamentous hemagglutinin N-terminal domain-containing protein [Nostoc sp. TCL26-01]|uniref:beta strand repeat-containing protein n=1 Tax=Nostoc sp. TCL26-01 TaxID=2576904 RepID=UPI0015BD84F4|nr:filamentous hemagglutinin N-terminal domain-containing protein [Nostoc sp. TCL26-01]QLE59829.1 filamentous hemagglutinin N-terminal domain-containing protein [Nostoc sp. TCL26-01]